MARRVLVALGLWAWCSFGMAGEFDLYLGKVVETFGLEPLAPVKRERDAKYELGRALFFV